MLSSRSSLKARLRRALDCIAVSIVSYRKPSGFLLQVRSPPMSATIHQVIRFKASAKRIYEALLDAKQFSQFSGGAPAQIDPAVGGPFSCFGGMITGRNIELKPNARIVQAWRAGNWPDGVYSVVRFELTGEGAATTLTLD